MISKSLDQLNKEAVTKITSTDNAIVRFDGTTGEVQNSGVVIDDNDNVIIGYTGISAYGKLAVTGATFDPSDAVKAGSPQAIFIYSGNSTIGLDALGTGIVFSKFEGSSRPAAAIVPWQSSTDEDQLGLKIFTHSYNTSTDTLNEALSINHAGRIDLKGLDRKINLYGTDGVGYGTVGVSSGTNGGISLKSYSTTGYSSVVDISAISTSNAGIYRIGRDSNIAEDQIAEFQIYKHDGTSGSNFRINCKTGDIITMGALNISKVAVTDGSLESHGNVFSGTYLPVITNVTNVTSSSASTCQYMRVGNVVVVSGSMTLTANNNIGTLAEVRLSVPIPSNITYITNVGGYGGATSTPDATSTGSFLGGASFTNIVAYKFNPYRTSAQTHNFTFTYIIL